MTTLAALGINLDTIADPAIRQAVGLLFNLVEELSGENERLRKENQSLRDEIARLKGEQGKPNIRGRNQGNRDISSESDRPQSHPPKAKGSKRQLTITRTETVSMDQAALPADARFKGYQVSLIQDLIITPEMIELKRETYYSPSLQQVFTAPLPAGYAGSFGPRLKSIVILLKTLGNMTEPAITSLLHSFGVSIGKSSIDRILLQDTAPLQKEKPAIMMAGLQSTSYQHLDDTSARVRGENWHTHVLCNPYYSAFFTRAGKDRLTVLTMLSGADKPEELVYVWNSEAHVTLAALGWANKRDKLLTTLPRGTPLTHTQLTAWAAEHEVSGRALSRLREAMALAGYHAREDIPRLSILMADDAPQWKLLANELALCWIHDGRHYKKLNPVIPGHRRILDNFLKDYWAFYHALLAYKLGSNETVAAQLKARFTELFSTKTGYDQLDKRIALTKAKQQELLLVLTHPEVPLHNNPAELAARAQVRKRDISLHTMTPRGTQAQDALLTTRETASKLGVNLYEYILDRVSNAYILPSLAETILRRSGATVWV